VIFVSTGGRRDQTAIQTALDFYQAGIRHVELSGGSYSNQFEKDSQLLPADLMIQVHNYFPPPVAPFVFNLASEVEEIANLSINHAQTAIKIASTLERSIYSFHAGFRINPHASELGKKLETRQLMKRSDALDLFMERVCHLSKYAEGLGVQLLIENNVITQSNFNRFGEDPLLMTDPVEIISVMREMPKNVGLLVDVAHLKVSSHALKFDLVNAHDRLKPWIHGYHLSDNDGSVDSNEPILASSWFWEYLLRDLDYYTLEVYGVLPQDLYLQQCLFRKMISKKSG
jgi:sugar phosphate isomerase/epimerase